MEPLEGPGLTSFGVEAHPPGAGTAASAAAPTNAPVDVAFEPPGFVVLADDGTRIHFLDWGGPEATPAPRVLLIPGLAATAWSLTPVARRLRSLARVVVMDLRGHGLSDAPADGYEPGRLVDDAIAAAEGSGVLLPDRGLGGPFVVAGHGFGGVVAAWAAHALGERCDGLVLIDGGWEDLAATSGSTPDEWLAAIEEPPEVLASMRAWLADRRSFDPGSWDADQERAARDQVVETAAGRVKRAVHPHAIAGSVRALLLYEPAVVIPAVAARVVALVARDDEAGGRAAALREVAALRSAAGRSAIAVERFPALGHNLPRYVPDAVASAIIRAAGPTERSA